jgi:hypothetical protein
MPTPDRAVSVHPYWKVSEGKMEEFKALCQEFLSAVGREPQCLYYGFSFNGDEVFCREAYDGAEGVLAHLANVGDLLQRALNIARLPRLEIHGPDEELAKLREAAAAFQPIYFTLQYGIRR